MLCDSQCHHITYSIHELSYSCQQSPVSWGMYISDLHLGHAFEGLKLRKRATEQASCDSQVIYDTLAFGCWTRCYAITTASALGSNQFHLMRFTCTESKPQTYLYHCISMSPTRALGDSITKSMRGWWARVCKGLADKELAGLDRCESVQRLVSFPWLMMTESFSHLFNGTGLIAILSLSMIPLMTESFSHLFNGTGLIAILSLSIIPLMTFNNTLDSMPSALFSPLLLSSTYM